MTLTLEEALFVEFLKRENNHIDAECQKHVAMDALAAAKVFRRERDIECGPPPIHRVCEPPEHPGRICVLGAGHSGDHEFVPTRERGHGRHMNPGFKGSAKDD